MTEPDDPQPTPADASEGEVVDAIPVPDGPPPHPDDVSVAPLQPSRGGLTVSGPIVRHAAAVAVTGLAAGVATVAVVRARRARTSIKRRPRAKASPVLTEVRATRSFLVDVHFLGSAD